MNKITTAMVFAAGRGERMRPLTLTTPKPLLQLGGASMLDQALAHLAAYGVERVVVNSHYLAAQIHQAMAARQASFPAELIPSFEPELLETGGGLRQARKLLGDAPIFVLNGDCVWHDAADAPSNLSRLAAAFDPASMDALLLVIERAQATGYDGAGDFLADCGDFADFVHNDGLPAALARRGTAAHAPLVFAGIHVLNPRLIDLAAPDAPKFSVNKLWDHALAQNRVYGLALRGRWFHVGTPHDLVVADKQLREGLIKS